MLAADDAGNETAAEGDRAAAADEEEVFARWSFLCCCFAFFGFELVNICKSLAQF